MIKYVLFNEFGKRKLTTEENYNTVIQNAGKIVDFSNFASTGSAIRYLITEWGLSREQIIDKTDEA